MTAGDLSLDPARRRVTRAGVEIVLTPREHGLLEYLMRHKGLVVSKGEILRVVVGPGSGEDAVPT